MAYNKETHRKETVIVPIYIADFISEDVIKEKRSRSSQISYILEQYYAQRRVHNELEVENPQYSTGKKIR